jgi:glycosyltransferase involved in cell wall biosynthesis
MKKPKVSIVLPIYNAEQFIGGVLESIIAQTFTDFEVIALDDGSKDKSAEVVKKFASIDGRIKYFYQPNNGAERLGETINTGIDKASADLIARADADDPWLYDKLEKQIAYLDKHPKCVLVGGGAEITNHDGSYNWTLLSPTTDEMIRRSMTLYTPFNHGSVVFRKAAWENAGKYSNARYVEDLDLWMRMLDFGTGYNIPSPVFHYRLNPGGISLNHKDEQVNAVHNAGHDYWKAHRPTVYARKDVKDRLSKIRKVAGDRAGAISWAFLEDNLVIANKFIKWDKNISGGLKQMFAVAFSCKMGLKLFLKRTKGKFSR